MWLPLGVVLPAYKGPTTHERERCVCVVKDASGVRTAKSTVSERAHGSTHMNGNTILCGTAEWWLGEARVVRAPSRRRSCSSS
jgi:hypothetical protein